MTDYEQWFRTELHRVITQKIATLKKDGLPDQWAEALKAPIISEAELAKEHDRTRENCTRSSYPERHADHCKTPNACTSCKMFDPVDYSIGPMLGERGDILLYPLKKTEAEFNQLFDAMTTAIAVMSFIPGGVPEFLGHHYASEK